MELFYGILVAIALSVVIMLFQKRKKKESWQGVVTKVKEEADYYDDENNFREGMVVIHYRTDAGKKGKFRLRKNQFGKMFPNLKAGDRLAKQAGEALPQWAK